MKSKTIIYVVIGLVVLWVVYGLTRNSTVTAASTASLGGVDLGSVVDAASGLLSNGLSGSSGSESSDGTLEYGDDTSDDASDD